MNNEIEKYKDYPDGSGGKMQYDYHKMPFPEWVNKYFKDIELKGWHGFLKWANEALEKSEDFEKVWCKNRVVAYNYDLLNSTYEKLKELNLFDDDIDRFIAFMAGEGFFEDYKITLEDWLNSKNWQNPSKECSQLNTCLTLTELILIKHGKNYIKKFLAGMDYWKVF